MRGAAALLLLCLAALSPGCAGCGRPPSGPVGPGPAGSAAGPALVLLPLGAPPSGRGLPEARVEIAAEEPARRRGLMGREFLRPGEGMLFVYPSDAEREFWMKDCPLPLAAAFIDAAGRILNIEEMAPGAGLPEDRVPRAASAGPARYVLEMEGGWFARAGIAAGDRVDLEAALRGVVAR
ncbi:MAG: DUF192 domain-containing protein [Planctomycetes bacterium]|nr:DUF192 domain-containing protein [Planctomycetota bacterium]